MPVQVEMMVPFDYHGQLIGQKGKEIRQIMDECEVTIIIPKPDDRSNTIKISGPPGKIAHAQDVIQGKVQRLEDDRKQRVRDISVLIYILKGVVQANACYKLHSCVWDICFIELKFKQT